MILGKWGIGLGALLLVTVSDARAIDVFQNNEAALLARKQAIVRAKPSDPIDVMTFTFRYGRSSAEIVGLLGQAARSRLLVENAAPIRLSVDGRFAFTPLFKREVALLAWAEAQGVQVRIYNPMNLSNLSGVPWINHRKFLMVGDTVFFGGRNLAPHYLESTPSDPGFMDIDLRFNPGEVPDLAFEFSALGGPDQETWKGLPLKRKLSRLFDEMWESSLSVQLTELQRSLAPLAMLPPLKVSPETPPYLELPPSQGWEMLRSEWDPRYDDFHRSLVIAIDQEPAGGEIYFESPYFMPSQEILAALRAALARGVRVTLFTNTFMTLNGASKAIALFMDRHYRDLIARGADVRFTQSRMLHAKVFAFGRTGLNYLGSHNAHRRSGLFDLETMLAWREQQKGAFIRLRRDFWEKGEGRLELGAYRPVTEDVVELLSRLSQLESDEAGYAIKIAQTVLHGVISKEELESPAGRAKFKERLDAVLPIVTWIFEDPVGAFL